MAHNWAAPLFAKLLGRQWRKKQKDDQVILIYRTDSRGFDGDFYNL